MPDPQTQTTVEATLVDPPVSVLLVSPGNNRRSDRNFGDSHLVALGSYLQVHTRADVELIDLDYERFLPRPQPHRVFDPKHSVVGVSCFSSYDYLAAYYLGREIRRRNPEVVLVAGGYHPSTRPGDFLNVPESSLDERSPFDYVVIGEGELPLARIVAAAGAGERLSQPVLGPESVNDLNDLPPMNWNLLDRYREIARSIAGQFNMPLSRGCPFQCSFCMERAKGESQWRAWSPAHVEEEIQRLDRWLPLKDWKLVIADPVFGLDASWRREVLDRLARLDLGIAKYWALSRVDILDPQDIFRFHGANFGLGFGLESGDPEMLKVIGKTRDPAGFLERFVDLSRTAADAGLPWGANIIAGHPGETEQSLCRSAKFVERLFLETTNLTGFLSVDPFRYYPGSRVDLRRGQFEGEFGMRVHRRRWWNYSDQSFTSEWVDPSLALDYRQKESLAADLFEPIVHAIAHRFAYAGPSSDYFRRAVTRACRDFSASAQLKTLSYYFLWRRLTKQDTAHLADDRHAAKLLRQMENK